MFTSSHVHRSLESLSKKKLDDKLHDIKNTAKTAYNKYKDHYLTTGKFGGYKVSPIFITNHERIRFYSIENQTKVEIKDKILELLDEMPDQNEALRIHKLITGNKYKSKRHDQLIQYYYDTATSLETQKSLSKPLAI